ncbi:MAG: hypothetical protein ABSD27_08730 [Bryobacteraceae bacterium]
MLFLRGVLILIAAGCALAQSVRVYSEFQRIDPFGNVVEADRAETPREILSPRLLRHTHTSLVVAVTPPPGQLYWVFIGQNPEHSVGLTVYRAVFVQRGAAWIPDALEPVQVNESGLLASAPLQVPGQTTVVYWVDLWVDQDATVRRSRLEIQLNSGGRWFIYPLELRVLAPRVPTPRWPLEPLASVDAPSSESARAVLRPYICGAAAPGAEGTLTIRKLIRRNARRDVALARSLESSAGGAGLIAELIEALGGGDRAKWCRAPAPVGALGAEWYLRARDCVYRAANRAAAAEPPPQAPASH